MIIDMNEKIWSPDVKYMRLSFKTLQALALCIDAHVCAV